MSNFKGAYLRIETPRTTDGINLKMGPDLRPIFKETHVPLTALKQFEKENIGRPEHLKHRITKVDPDTFQPSQIAKKPVDHVIPVEAITDDTDRVYVKSEKPKAKSGRKPRTVLQ